MNKNQSKVNKITEQKRLACPQADPILPLAASLVAQKVKCLPVMWETWFQSLGQEDPLEKEMATHFSMLAWKIPWMEEPGGLQSTASQSRTWPSEFTSSLLLPCLREGLRIVETTPLACWHWRISVALFEITYIETTGCTYSASFRTLVIGVSENWRFLSNNEPARVTRTSEGSLLYKYRIKKKLGVTSSCPRRAS